MAGLKNLSPAHMAYKGITSGSPPSSIGGMLTRGPALWKPEKHSTEEDSGKKDDIAKDMLRRSVRPAYKTIASGFAWG